MKLKKLFLALSAATLFSALFVACEEAPKTENAPEFKQGIIVLNEGLFPSGAATLTYWGLDTTKAQTCFFEAQNGRSLGTIGNDLKQYGSKIYAVINLSSTLEVINRADGKSITQISLKNKQGLGRQPRFIDFSGAFAYVCSSDGTVSKIDTASLAVVDTCLVGRNPDGIKVVGSKLFVSNSGGLDPNFNYANSVSVIDLNTFTEKKQITVGKNPGMMQVDSQGDLYVITRGDYVNEFKKLYIINTATDEVKAIKDDVQPEKFVIYGDKAYMYGISYDANYNAVASFFQYDVITETLINTPFVTLPADLKTPYAIAVDPKNGDIYISDCKDYTQTGDLFRFSNNGTLISQQETGINPGAILILK